MQTNMSNAPAAPIILELAPLPREQVGPFLLLGLEKTADKDVIEASWAKRVLWARKDQIKVALEDPVVIAVMSRVKGGKL